uniref:Terminase n=1 Tax=uncultured marine virus TaxID=186617 RepID=A0A0F7L5F1_9VIRU|nr:terminase [uncultured marine virus]
MRVASLPPIRAALRRITSSMSGSPSESMTSTSAGVRAWRHRPGSAASLPVMIRYRAAHSEQVSFSGGAHARRSASVQIPSTALTSRPPCRVRRGRSPPGARAPLL